MFKYIIYKNIFTMIDLFQKTLLAYIKGQKRELDVIYFVAKLALETMLEKSFHDNDFRLQLYDWLTGKTSTIELRRLMKSVGIDYWKEPCNSYLINSNACDLVDSVAINFRIIMKCKDMDKQSEMLRTLSEIGSYWRSNEQ